MLSAERTICNLLTRHDLTVGHFLQEDEADVVVIGVEQDAHVSRQLSQTLRAERRVEDVELEKEPVWKEGAYEADEKRNAQDEERQSQYLGLHKVPEIEALFAARGVDDRGKGKLRTKRVEVPSSHGEPGQRRGSHAFVSNGSNTYSG